MKAFMLDMMVAMMPYMKPLLWLGVAAAVLALVLRLVMLASPGLRSGVIWTSSVAGAIGVFFLICQVMGLALGAAPAFNLADATKFEFWMVPFWQAGIALLAPAIIAGYGVRAGAG